MEQHSSSRSCEIQSRTFSLEKSKSQKSAISTQESSPESWSIFSDEKFASIYRPGSNPRFEFAEVGCSKLVPLQDNPRENCSLPILSARKQNSSISKAKGQISSFLFLLKMIFFRKYTFSTRKNLLLYSFAPRCGLSRATSAFSEALESSAALAMRFHEKKKRLAWLFIYSNKKNWWDCRRRNRHCRRRYRRLFRALLDWFRRRIEKQCSSVWIHQSANLRNSGRQRGWLEDSNNHLK